MIMNSSGAAASVLVRRAMSTWGAAVPGAPQIADATFLIGSSSNLYPALTRSHPHCGGLCGRDR